MSQREITKPWKLVINNKISDRVRSLAIQQGLWLQPVLVHMERIQSRLLWHLSRKPHGSLSVVFWACLTWSNPELELGLPEEIINIYQCAWEPLSVPSWWVWSGWNKESMGLSALTAASVTQTRISSENWMNEWIVFVCFYKTHHK